MHRRPLPLILAVLLSSASGCAHLASDIAGSLMVQAPNRVDPRIRTVYRKPPQRRSGPLDRRFWVGVGPPAAQLLVRVIEARPQGSPPVGTILLLHGAYSRSEHLAPTASRFASGGYRCVLVDLRGHGQSTGDRMTYGVRESEDLSQVIDALERRELLTGNLGVYGFSYGGSTALQLAGRDERVRAVVAVAPFNSLRQVAGDLARTRLPGAAWYASDAWIDRTLNEAGRQGGFDFRQADAGAAIRRTDAMVRLIHGTADDFVEPRHSMDLHLAATDHSDVVLIEGADHDDLALDVDGRAALLGLSWFDRWLRPHGARRPGP